MQMNLFMVTILVLISILAIRGTLYNKKNQNNQVSVNGGIFTIGLVGIALLSVFDLFFGADTLISYLPW